MARQPEVFVRSLEPEEAQRLVKITRTTKDRVRLAPGRDRAGVGSGPECCGGGGHVRDEAAVCAGGDPRVQRAGVRGVGPKMERGPTERGSAPRFVKRSAGSPRPRRSSWAGRSRRGACRSWSSTWPSTSTSPSAPSRCARSCATAGIRWQATKTWKASKDPDFAAKMARVLDLYDHPPADGRVICVDEFGPLNLQPRPGRGWFPTGRPARLRATFNRTGGVRHMFAALDLATGQMFYRFRDRKRWTEFLGFLKQLRARFPTGKLYVVCDNYGPHKKAEVVDWCQRQRGRAGVHPEQRVVVELDRVRVHRPAVLHPRRQRLPQPHRPGDRDRRLRPLAQQTRPTQTTLRHRLQDPPTRLPTQRCLTRH